MHRFTVAIASLALGVALVQGAAAQETPPTVATVADGGYSSADPSNPLVVSEGENRVYGDIATGNTGGEVYGDPAALANIQTADEIAASVPPVNLTPGNSPSDGVLPAPPAESGTTVSTEATDGSTSGAAPVTEGTAPAPAPVAEGTTPETAAAPVSACGGYGTWYDAQVAYEAGGGLGGDQGVVQAVDPDFDGVACEELIVY